MGLQREPDTTERAAHRLQTMGSREKATEITRDVSDKPERGLQLSFAHRPHREPSSLTPWLWTSSFQKKKDNTFLLFLGHEACVIIVLTN